MAASGEARPFGIRGCSVTIDPEIRRRHEYAVEQASRDWQDAREHLQACLVQLGRARSQRSIDQCQDFVYEATQREHDALQVLMERRQLIRQQPQQESPTNDNP